MKAEDIYSLYSSNPTKWMKENSCTTTKEITVILMKQYADGRIEEEKENIRQLLVSEDLELLAEKL